MLLLQSRAYLDSANWIYEEFNCWLSQAFPYLCRYVELTQTTQIETLGKNNLKTELLGLAFSELLLNLIHCSLCFCVLFIVKHLRTFLKGRLVSVNIPLPFGFSICFVCFVLFCLFGGLFLFFVWGCFGFFFLIMENTILSCKRHNNYFLMSYIFVLYSNGHYITLKNPAFNVMPLVLIVPRVFFHL